jgi:transcriptional regulator with XRE-family HTH domain
MARSRVANGPAILARRERLGILQQDLAARVGVSASYLSRIETGTEEPGLTSQTVRKLAVELGMSLDDITIPAVVAAEVPEGADAA